MLPLELPSSRNKLLTSFHNCENSRDWILLRFRKPRKLVVVIVALTASLPLEYPLHRYATARGFKENSNCFKIIF